MKYFRSILSKKNGGGKMSELRCGKCGRTCGVSEIYVCDECGSFLCEECKNSAHSICPDCYGRLIKLC